MFFVAKGLRSTWDRLGDISGAVIQLQNVKKQVTKALGASYEGKTHTTLDTSMLVWKVAKKVRELSLNKYQPSRKGNDKQKVVPNLIDVGERKLLSSSLESFNKRLMCMKTGNLDEVAGIAEEDEIPSVQLTVELNEALLLYMLWACKRASRPSQPIVQRTRSHLCPHRVCARLRVLFPISPQAVCALCVRRLLVFTAHDPCSYKNPLA